MSFGERRKTRPRGIGGKSELKVKTMTSSLEVDEAASAAVAVAPRVTLESMEAKIASENYTVIDGILTLCTLKMANGFYVVGESAPASPANFNPDLGCEEELSGDYNPMCIRWSDIEDYAMREQLSRA